MKRLFYAVFIPCLIAILTVVILHPQNNLVPSRMFLYMLIWILILAGMKAVLIYLERILLRKEADQAKINGKKISRIGMILFILLYGVALYYVSVVLRSDPVTDYKEIYQTALKLSANETVTDWSYFSMWTNNLGPLTILTFCMRLGRFFGFSDPYYFVLGVNVFQMMLVAASVFYLAGKFGEKRISTQWFAMLVFALWMPVWTSTNAFYSDQLSFGGGIIGAALLTYGVEDSKGIKYRKWICTVLAGVMWGVAVRAKATAAVGLVALLILLMLSFKRFRRQWKEFLVFFAVFCVVFGGLHLYDQTYPSKADEYRLKTPPEFWIAMGLVGNGTYSDNAYLIKECNYKQNVEERRRFCREIIRDNLINLGDADHMYKKTSIIFGSGDILPTSLMYPEQESFLWQCVYWEGKYYWKYACVSTAFFFAVLLLMLTGSIFQAVSHKPDDLAFLTYLTVFGLFLFLMCWEAQNKQLYNHIPWMTLAAVYGMERAEAAVRSTTKNRK